MNTQSKTRLDPDRAVAIEIQPSSPRYTKPSPFSPDTPTRRIAIAVDLSDESAFAVKWAVQNYLRPTDTVTMLHVRPTSILYGADWGSTHFTLDDPTGAAQKTVEDDFDKLTAEKVSELAAPLLEAKIPFRVHIVKDHDMKERLCLEIERLGLSAVVMGSRGFGASRRRRIGSKARLGSVSDYCVHHCVCPVVVVRYESEEGEEEDSPGGSLHPVPEEDHDDTGEEHDHYD